MQRAFVIVVAVLALAAATAPVRAALPIEVDETWIVVLDDSAPAVERAAGMLGVDPASVGFVFENVLNGFTFTGTAREAQILALAPIVLTVQPDRIYQAAVESGGSGFLRIDGDLTYVSGDQGLMADGNPVRIAVLDSGIMTTHPDLSPNLDLTQSTNCVNPGTPPEDDAGHGTHVAGIAAAADQGSGIVGVASKAKIVAAKVLDSTGAGTESQIICGLDFVAGLAADGVPTVANLSFGSDHLESTGCNSSVLHQAICNLDAAGVTIVTAAGNNGGSADNYYPAAYPETIAVSAWTAFDGDPGSSGCGYSGGAVECDEALTSFTNYGAKVDVTAPGASVYSTTFDGAYGRRSGTSMAAPFVTGVAALILAADPTLTPGEVRSILQASGECPDGTTSGAATCAGKGLWEMSDGSTGTAPEPDGIPEPLVNARSAVDAGTDTTPPAVIVAGPANWSTVSAPVAITGTATDDRAVDAVHLEIYDRDSALWWNGSGWQAGRMSFVAVLDTPGGTSSGWSYDFDPGTPSLQPYWVTIRSFDTSANASGYVYRNFALTVSDVTPPTVSVSGPGNWSTQVAPVSITGTATDDRAVDAVHLEVYDRDSALWWNGTLWQAGRTFFTATLDAPGGTSTGWSYDFDPGTPASQPYWVTMRSFDAATNASSYRYVNFTVTTADATPPSVSVSTPVNWSSQSAPVSITGTATDDVGVDAVSLEVYDRDTTMWWNGSGWQAGRTSFVAALDTPGGTSSGWSYDFDPGTPASQPYWVTMRSFDAATNASTFTYLNFTVTSLDTTSPSVSVSSPVNWSTVSSPVSVTGTATDDVGVDAVRLEVYDRDTTMWWNGSAWQAGRTSFIATLDAPGGTSSGWSYDLDPPTLSPQPYWVTIRSFDAAGNPSAFTYLNFAVVNP